MRIRPLLGCLLLTILPLSAQTAAGKAPDPSWAKIEFLLGQWTGTAGPNDTALGAGQGDFSFVPELNRKIVVRHNRADYNSGVSHDDLLVIYLDAPGDIPRAVYFDSEGHVIRYNLTFPSANRVLFESEGTQPGPRYRLSYWLEGATLNGKFEVAPPGAPYQAYLSWTARKK